MTTKSTGYMEIEKLYEEYDIADLIVNCSYKAAVETMWDEFGLSDYTIDALFEYHKQSIGVEKGEI